MIKKVSILFALFFLILADIFAIDGFREFTFGDSSEKVQETGRKLCSFSDIAKDTRWLWKSYISCQNYEFKKGTKTSLFFQFSDDELVKIYVVSKNINNYFLLRYPKYDFLVPLSAKDSANSVMNLADRLITRDKVHMIEKGYRYTTFFHEGVWEWEFVYEDIEGIEDDKEQEEQQLEEEEEKGLPGWNIFNFDESDEIIKGKLEGVCSSKKVSVGLEGEKILGCQDFPFMENKILVMFVFVQAKLIRIELKLEREWYDMIVPLLKEKYGRPYTELLKNDLYYPYIDFPEKNITALQMVKDTTIQNSLISINYYKEGFAGYQRFRIRDKTKKALTKPKSRTERIMDSL